MATMETTGTLEIEVPFPEVDAPTLGIYLGAGHLAVHPGEPNVLVQGAYDDPSGALPCEITQTAGAVRIAQRYRPDATFGLFQGAPRLDVKLGSAHPYPLTLETGAGESVFDLGGLPLSRLTVRQGAGKIWLMFGAPNPVPMEALTVSAGAGGMELQHLAAANCGRMTIEGGAASYILDFSGTLERPLQVNVRAGMSSVELRIPLTTAARITAETMLGHVAARAGFTLRQDAYWTAAALAGQTPLLEIHAAVALGAVELVGL